LLFSLVSETEITALMATFPGNQLNSGTIAHCPTCNSKKAVPAVLPAVVKMLDIMHKLKREPI
jgi:hypothetical protein